MPVNSTPVKYYFLYTLVKGYICYTEYNLTIVCYYDNINNNTSGIAPIVVCMRT